jgi:2-keto-4-pentenoate hydratase/2-oxohepta-3-ene-1,7-dioic acid hydratase in catechol pathway
MRLASQDGRSVLVTDDGVTDLARASGDRWGSDPMAALADWEAVREWAASARPGAERILDPMTLGPPVPRPAQVFAVALNYKDHAAEAGIDIPASPLIFTKFPSCLVGPCADVRLSSDRVDWEVELVVVIGRAARDVDATDALAHVAGYCVGQDISDRRLQFAGTPPQFSLGKSLPTYGPIGPAIVTLDEVSDPLDLCLTCDVGGERMQDGSTREMIFAVPELVSYLSQHTPLMAGDLIFTGTPAGVGSVRRPRRYLALGDVVESTIAPLGSLQNQCVMGAQLA